MSNDKIFITLPQNISFSVFEALKVHVDYFKLTGREVVYLSRNKQLTDDRMIYFDSIFRIIKYLRKQKNGILYGITVIEVIIAYLSNIFTTKKTIIFWVQGLIDEEDYFSNNKKYRYYIFNILLKIALRISSKLVLVTNEMHRVLLDKYNLYKPKEFIILNCVSRVKYNQTPKIKNSLCYIGGLSKWQNVDKILSFYNTLLKVNINFNLYIATFDHEKAKQLIKLHIDTQFNDKVILVNVKKQEEVSEFLSKMEYGFLIRDNVLLNNVASPIKLAEYLSCGVNPIISESLIEFHQLVEKNECGIIIKNGNVDNAIDNLINFVPSTERAISLYNTYFEKDEIVTELNEFLTD